MQHAFKTGLVHNKSSYKCRPKLTIDQVKEIRKKLENGKSCYELADEYMVTYGAIACIRNKSTWSYV